VKLDTVRRYAQLPLQEIEEADATHLDRDRYRLELAGGSELRFEHAADGGDVRAENSAARTSR
jgi:hypothetical protein